MTPDDLTDYVTAQLNSFFPDRRRVMPAEIESALNVALGRLEYCLSHVRGQPFQEGGESAFDHLHSDQYAMFLYFLSNTLYRRRGRDDICTKLFLLNKSLHGIDCFYAAKLPPIFAFVHPVGAVIGRRATYSNYLLISQNCTVGDNYDGRYPTLGEGVALYSGAMIIGDCKIGDNCEIAARTVVYKTTIPSGSLVLGQYPENIIKESNTSVIDKHFIT